MRQEEGLLVLTEIFLEYNTKNKGSTAFLTIQAHLFNQTSSYQSDLYYYTYYNKKYYETKT